MLNNAKEQVLMKAFGDASNSESSPYNQSVKELTGTILQQVRRLPGNQACCDCGAAGHYFHFHFYSLGYSGLLIMQRNKMRTDVLLLLDLYSTISPVV